MKMQDMNTLPPMTWVLLVCSSGYQTYPICIREGRMEISESDTIFRDAQGDNFQDSGLEPFGYFDMPAVVVPNFVPEKESKIGIRIAPSVAIDASKIDLVVLEALLNCIENGYTIAGYSDRELAGEIHDEHSGAEEYEIEPLVESVARCRQVIIDSLLENLDQITAVPNLTISKLLKSIIVPIKF